MTTELTEKLEAEFVSLVENSWKIHQQYYWNNSVDEILIGAVIRQNLDNGYLLIDLKSERPYNYYASQGADPSANSYIQPINKHYLRFENSKDKSRLVYELDRITTDLTDSRVLGQLSRITIAYGEKTSKGDQIWQTMKQELKTTLIDTSEPGIITFDVELKAGYVYASVSIILDINEYNKDKMIGNIDYDKLGSHMEAVIHSLKKALRGKGIL